MKVDLDLIRKYNVPGPRYTSYPPATHFTDEVDKGALMESIRKNNETQRDLSLYYHLPFCESLCWFCGCTTVITKDHSRSENYLNHIDREMDLMREHLNPDRKVVQVHLGGGTPTFLQPDELRRLGNHIRERFQFGERVEAGAEIDPRRITRDTIQALKDAGFNRASMGVQDHNPEVQKAIHRIQPYEMTRQAIDWLRECDFESLNVDLIYGLPYQTVDSFEKTLEDTLKLQPDRLAVFSYAHVPWIKPAQKILQERMELPSPETKLELLKLTIEKLTSEGYVYIGMDHFAKEDDELTVAQRTKTLQRNFQGYSTQEGVDIYAFGMSSISQSQDAYWQNLKELPDYCASVDEGKLPIQRGYILTEEDHLRRRTIMRLMCDLELDYANMSELLGLDFESTYAQELDSLKNMEEDGLIHKSATGLTVTELGRLLIRNIAMRFDGYQNERKEGRFSKTI
ncbi:MAG: oxygen-independent coproporphyrinogen III oxidase [Verrucomicrobia bacterium]|jgi:oxygen-independent coproporphyrinogen-3 oxidase|nr:oxygen-independent coproporphyrinogen III oxidase [Verrucomicrobiota bacterium]MBT4276598.1 oxygen-independent coproporphyrinogen III oxidase [Verrucomicrobiota bacterium]MBT5064545.1 oxygen-independent coproporphyrinogen III oxidase [Verrucomicrobiota bacterium]MBT5478993.1 oxygen-independent coproporphyrinogen III oxidase [Verrucomicrobiota bacterium]MBT6238866.1 oxygen-independent coproporphyrinogen III oxidase [Verrucomicrobiota bacterium]